MNTADLVHFSDQSWSKRDFDGARVTVMGLGLFGGGRDLTRFLCEAGAEVVVTDLRDAEALRPSVDSLAELPIRWVLGEHREEDLLKRDLVFVNPAIPRDVPLLRDCARRGVPLDTEMNLFFKLCPGKICGVTGSNGKTTTTSLIAEMARGRFPRVRLGGNMGISLLGELHSIAPDDWVVLELSSFQLEDLASLRRRPEIALVTNLAPNHLDRHGTYANYLAAKRVVLEGDGHAVLFGDEARTRSWAQGTRRSVSFFGRCGGVRPRAPGCWLEEGSRVVQSTGGDLSRPRTLFESSDLRLTGQFNVLNAAGAAAAALAMGCSAESILRGARSFEPIEHRLEFVREFERVRYYNDSIATTPESTLCAIEALGPKLVLIAGGSDKGTSFRRLGRAMALETRGVVLLGETASRIEAAVGESAAPRCVMTRASSLDEAVRAARDLARPGDAVALSPACASYDMFPHFAERGRRFKELVKALD